MKKLIMMVSLGLLSFSAMGQVTVFTESMGTVGGTTTIAAHESANGFDNDGYTMSGTADLRITTVSTGYSGASAGANVFLGTSGGNAKEFLISGVNTTGYSTLALSFGVLSTTASSPLTIEVSTDGVIYTSLTYTAPANTTWNLVSASGSIPATSDLRIRFSKNSTVSWRIDDVKLTGILNDAPTATSVSFSGTLTQGQLLTGIYTYADTETDPEGISTFKWYKSDDASGTNKTAIDGATNSTFTLTASEVGKYISFEVTPVASTGTTTGSPVESAINASAVQASSNSAPVAAAVLFSGTLTEGQTLTGSYTYSDIDEDPEGTSTFKWYRSNDNIGTGKSVISGAVSSSYQLTISDAAKYISFEVTPVASSGTLTGTAAESALQGPIDALPNDAPVATAVDIAGNLVEGQTLNGIYTYSDTEENPEGATTFQWYRSDDEEGTNTVAIPSANAIDYQLVAADIGKFIWFEVTPKASVGSINGTPVESPVYGIVIAQPVLTIVGTVPSFGSVGVGESSTEKFYKVHGSNLLSDLVITAPSSFEISLTSGSGFGSSINLTPNSGTVDTTIIYVRFSPTVLGAASGNITNESNLITTQNVAVSGTGALALPLTEDFNYADGSALTANGWTAHSAGANPVSVGVSNGLSFSHYDGSGVGNAALVNNTGEDVSLLFGTQTSGDVYASFLVNVNSIPTSGYFAHFGGSSSLFAARIFAQNSGTAGKINFGLSNTSTATYSSTDFNDSTTYLIVIRYEIATSNSSMWVFDNEVPSTEEAAGTPLVTATGTGISSVDRFALRQFNAGQKITVDGLKVAASWIDANLPDNNPELKSLTRTPFIPNPSQDVVITATATDDWAVTAVGMQYRINNGTFNMVWFNHVSDSTYSYTISESEINNGDYLEYYLFVDDDGGHEISTAGTMSKVFVGTVDVAGLRSNDGDGVNNYNGAYANVSGVATIATGIFGAANMNFYIQDATGGINVFKTDVIFTATKGNHYSVIGRLNQISGNLIIIPDDVNTQIADLGSAALPASKDHIITLQTFFTDPESYEGELVTFANVYKSSGTWPVSAGFVNVYIKDGSTTDSLAVRIKVSTAGTEPVGNFSVEGVLNQLDLSSPYTSGYQVQPRSSSDFYAAGAFDFVTIPDVNLKSALLGSDIDNNVDGEITYTEALGLVNFEAGETGISDLTGLDAFTNLTYLSLPANNLETADLSALTNLTSINLSNNNLNSINLSGLENVTELRLNNNSLPGIDISDLTALEILYLNNNSLAGITYSEHPSLAELYINNNEGWEVSEIDLTSFPSIEVANVAGLNLTGLNVAGLESLYSLDFSDNSIESIELNSILGLSEIYGSNNPLTTLDISLLTGITNFVFANNTLLGDVLVPELPFEPSVLDTTGSTNVIFKVFTVPVEMKSFTVSAAGSSARLDWSTASESNNAGWEVERRTISVSSRTQGDNSSTSTGHAGPAETWKSIGFVAGKGTTSEAQTYSFSDIKISGKAEYRLKQIDTDGKVRYSNILAFELIPTEFSVSANYPNPFNPSTNFRFDLPKTAHVKIVVSNILGQQVATVVNREFTAKSNIEVPFNAVGLASGMYYYTITVDSKSITKTMMLVK